MCEGRVIKRLRPGSHDKYRRYHRSVSRDLPGALAHFAAARSSCFDKYSSGSGRLDRITPNFISTPNNPLLSREQKHHRGIHVLPLFNIKTLLFSEQVQKTRRVLQE